MNIASALPGMMPDLTSQVSVAVAKKARDVQKEQGEAMVAMLQDAARTAAAQTGRSAEPIKPGALDVMA